jgi:hypothetical protein
VVAASQHDHSLPGIRALDLAPDQIDRPEIGRENDDLLLGILIPERAETSQQFLLNEKQPVTTEMAVRFGKLFGNGAGFWVSLQRIHDLALAERTVDVSRIPTIETQTG